MNDIYKVKILDITSANEQIEIYRQAFDCRESFENLKKFWIKKHYENPFQKSFLFGAFDNDRLISMNAYMPLEYLYNNNTIRVVESCESCTLSEYQGKGIWSTIVKEAMKYFKEQGIYDCMIGFPNYSNSYNGFTKMNWLHINDVYNYILIVNGTSFINATLGLMKFPLAKIFELQKAVIRLSRHKAYYAKDSTSSFGRQFTKDIFNLHQTKAFLDWKTEYKNLLSFSMFDDKGQELAICRYSLEKYHSSDIVKLHSIDLTGRSINIKTAYSFCFKEIIRRHNNIAFIRVWACKENTTSLILTRMLFLKSTHHNPFMVFPLKECNIKVGEVRNKQNWRNISFIDLD